MGERTRRAPDAVENASAESRFVGFEFRRAPFHLDDFRPIGLLDPTILYESYLNSNIFAPEADFL